MVTTEKQKMAKTRERAMTLVELLVSLAILSTMMLFLFMVFSQARKSWLANENKSGKYREARAALHVLSRDISHSLKTLPYFYRRGEGGVAEGELAFFLIKTAFTYRAEKNKGDICRVGYYTAITQDASGNFSRKLYRQFVNSDSAFEDLQTIVLEQDTAQDEPIAYNVIGFSVVPWYHDGNGELTEINTNEFPACWDLVLRVTDNEIAQRLMKKADWEGKSSEAMHYFDSDENFYNDKGVMTFTLRVFTGNQETSS